MPLFVAVGAAIGFILSLPLQREEFSISEMRGGAVMTDFPTANALTPSELKWFVVNQIRLPCKLENSGIAITPKQGSYLYSTRGQLTSQISVSQIEVHFLLFDEQGKHLRTLVRKEDVKLSPGSSVLLDKSDPWTYGIQEAKGYWASVAFVTKLLGSDGKQWTAPLSQIQELVETLKPKLKKEKD